MNNTSSVDLVKSLDRHLALKRQLRCTFIEMFSLVPVRNNENQMQSSNQIMDGIRTSFSRDEKSSGYSEKSKKLGPISIKDGLEEIYQRPNNFCANNFRQGNVDMLLPSRNVKQNPVSSAISKSALLQAALSGQSRDFEKGLSYDLKNSHSQIHYELHTSTENTAATSRISGPFSLGKTKDKAEDQVSLIQEISQDFTNVELTTSMAQANMLSPQPQANYVETERLSQSTILESIKAADEARLIVEELASHLAKKHQPEISIDSVVTHFPSNSIFTAESNRNRRSQVINIVDNVTTRYSELSAGSTIDADHDVQSETKNDQVPQAVKVSVERNSILCAELTSNDTSLMMIKEEDKHQSGLDKLVGSAKAEADELSNVLDFSAQLTPVKDLSTNANTVEAYKEESIIELVEAEQLIPLSTTLKFSLKSEQFESIKGTKEQSFMMIADSNNYILPPALEESESKIESMELIETIPEVERITILDSRTVSILELCDNNGISNAELAAKDEVESTTAEIFRRKEVWDETFNGHQSHLYDIREVEMNVSAGEANTKVDTHAMVPIEAVSIEMSKSQIDFTSASAAFANAYLAVGNNDRSISTNGVETTEIQACESLIEEMEIQPTSYDPLAEQSMLEENAQRPSLQTAPSAEPRNSTERQIQVTLAAEASVLIQQRILKSVDNKNETPSKEDASSTNPIVLINVASGASNWKKKFKDSLKKMPTFEASTCDINRKTEMFETTVTKAYVASNTKVTPFSAEGVMKSASKEAKSDIPQLVVDELTKRLQSRKV